MMFLLCKKEQNHQNRTETSRIFFGAVFEWTDYSPPVLCRLVPLGSGPDLEDPRGLRSVPYDPETFPRSPQLQSGIGN